MKNRTLYFFLLLGVAVPANAQTFSNTHVVVMTSLRTGETEIFKTDLQTGDTKNLTNAPRSEDRYPAVSYDGKQVLFTSNRWDNDTAFNLFRMNADGRAVQQLTFEKKEVVYYPGWSADGKTILYNLGNRSAVVVMDADGKNKKEIAEARDGFLSPDGKTIAFTRRCGSGFCLFVMNRDGSTVRQLTENANEMGAVGPVISPDGQTIAYVDKPEEDKDVLEIFSCSPDGSNRRQLTHLGKVSTSPCWSPDGALLSFRVTADAFWRNAESRAAAYQGKAGDKRPVWIMNRDGSNAHAAEPLRFQCGIDGSRASFIN